MNIPLDRLYNFLSDVVNRDDIRIYCFKPHGSKKPEDLKPLVDREKNLSIDKLFTDHILIFHDQEPLFYDLYASIPAIINTQWQERNWVELIEFYKTLTNSGLKNIVPWANINLNDRCILVHSEKNSKELLRYEQNGYAGVYYWSHAIIAADWYRFAKFDPILKTQRDPTTNFLIYNRSWTGTREYRIKFCDLIVENNLQEQCKITFNPNDEYHWKDHQYSNRKFQPVRQDLDKIFSPTTAGADSSADYCAKDYLSSMFEIVLETLFDDTRHHLTEKIFRPIACEQPFILAATPYSLEYLRSYGFKTFAPWINENYDTIVDPLERLNAIVLEMKRISNLTHVEKIKVYSECRSIAKFNKDLFFSEKFSNQIVNEFLTNFYNAVEDIEQTRAGKVWIESRKFAYKYYKSTLFDRKQALKYHLWLKNKKF